MNRIVIGVVLALALWAGPVVAADPWRVTPRQMAEALATLGYQAQPASC